MDDVNSPENAPDYESEPYRKALNESGPEPLDDNSEQSDDSESQDDESEND